MDSQCYLINWCVGIRAFSVCVFATPALIILFLLYAW